MVKFYLSCRGGANKAIKLVVNEPLTSVKNVSSSLACTSLSSPLHLENKKEQRARLMQVFVHTHTHTHLEHEQKSRSRDSIHRIRIQIDFTEFYDRTSVYISNRCQTSFSCNSLPRFRSTGQPLSFNFFDRHRIQGIARMPPSNVIFIIIFTRTIDQVQNMLYFAQKESSIAVVYNTNNNST